MLSPALVVSAAPLAGDQLPHVTEEECRLLFSSFCVHGVLRVQARACALLLRLCGAQPWWGEMVVSTASDLFSPQQNTSFNKKRWGGVYISLYSPDFLSLSLRPLYPECCCSCQLFVREVRTTVRSSPVSSTPSPPSSLPPPPPPLTHSYAGFSSSSPTPSPLSTPPTTTTTKILISLHPP